MEKRINKLKNLEEFKMKKAAMVIGSVVIGGSLLTGYMGLGSISSSASANDALEIPNAGSDFDNLVDDQGREYGYDSNGEIIYFTENKEDGSSQVSTISDEIEQNSQSSFDTVKDQVISIQEKNVITKETSEYNSFGDLMNDLYAVVDPWNDVDGSEAVLSSEEEQEYYDAAVKFISYAKYFEDEIEENGWVNEVNKAMVYNVAIVEQDHQTDYSTRLNFGTGIINISADYNN